MGVECPLTSLLALGKTRNGFRLPANLRCFALLILHLINLALMILLLIISFRHKRKKRIRLTKDPAAALLMRLLFGWAIQKVDTPLKMQEIRYNSQQTVANKLPIKIELKSKLKHECTKKRNAAQLTCIRSQPQACSCHGHQRATSHTCTDHDQTEVRCQAGWRAPGCDGRCCAARCHPPERSSDPVCDNPPHLPPSIVPHLGIIIDCALQWYWWRKWRRKWWRCW